MDRLKVGDIGSSKDKTLLVCDNGLFFDFALKLTEHFKKVYYYTEWKNAYPGMAEAVVGTEWKNGKRLKTFDGKNIERIENMFSVLDEIDCFFTPDIYDGDLLELLERSGIPCFGSGKAECLELNRYETAVEMKGLGMDVARTINIVGMAALREHLKKNEDKFIKISKYRKVFETFHHINYKLSEPLLDNIENTLGPLKYIVEFVVVDNIEAIVEEGIDAYSVNGELPSMVFTGCEIKDVSYAGRLMKTDELSVGNKKVNEKFVKLLKKYDNSGFFSTEVRTTKEGKNYFIDPCFSEDTDILTDNGWKPIADIVVGDSVATLNTDTNQIEYQQPTDYIITPYEGKMIDITSPKKSIECRVTPNHLVLRTDRNGDNVYKEEAGKLKDKGYIPRTGEWNGEDFDYFELPEYHNEWDFIGKEGKKIMTKVKHDVSVKIEADDFAAFLGWYLSEGSTDTWNVNITQYKHKQKVKEFLDRLPFKYRDEKSGYRISSKQLVSYLDEFGISNEKFVPDFIKNACPRIINSFLDAYNLGDGSIHKNQRLYFTTSKKMADDLQELVLKAGRVANITIQQKAGTKMSVRGGKEYTRNHNIYVVSELAVKDRMWFEATGKRKDNYIKEVDYIGKVYCVTVPNGTVYVRRNGKPFWSSNCMRLGLPPNALYQEIYKNLGEIIWSGGNGILVDPKTDTPYGMEVLISSGWHSGNHQTVYFPPEIRQWVKLINPIKIDGTYHVLRTGDSTTIGSLVAVGKSHEECSNKLKKMAKLIEGYDLNVKIEGIEEAVEAFKTMEKNSKNK